MDKLLAAVFELVVDLHPNKVSALTSSIRKCTSNDTSTLNNYFSTGAANKALAAVLREWRQLGCSADELVGILKGVSHGYESEKARENVQLVWTGPDINQAPVRRSEQVLIELISTAQTSLFLVSFVLVNIPAVESALKKALERGVDVRMLIESEDKEGTYQFRETIKRLQTDIPGLTMYVWPRENRESAVDGFARVHAKCAVADQESAFITSANLTSAALDKNIEMGVHIQGGHIPRTIYRQFVGMIREKEITPFATNRYKLESAKIPKATPISQLPENLEVGSEKLISFHDYKLDALDERLFKVLGRTNERPKQNSLVVIRHEGQWLVGKYNWSKQQGTEGSRVFFLVRVRGFGPKQQFEIEESEWEKFMPIAVEIST